MARTKMNWENIKEEVGKMSNDEVEEKLKELSDSFKPTDNKVSLNLGAESSIENIKRSYCSLVMALKVLAENNYDEKIAKDLGFTEIYKSF